MEPSDQNFLTGIVFIVTVVISLSILIGPGFVGRDQVVYIGRYIR